MNNVSLLQQILKGNSLSAGQGLILYQLPLIQLGSLATEIRFHHHPERQVTFVMDRNINYTNVCTSGCLFCAFCTQEASDEAFILSRKEMAEKIEEMVELGGTQLLIQGGLHPGLDLDYFLDLFSWIKSNFTVHIHSLSPPEIWHLSDLSGLSLRDVLSRLQQAGLDSLPGGGAEILVDRVRSRISPNKIGWRQWMEVMEEAHQLGMPTTATMMFGTIETREERIKHLCRIRQLQERTGGFTAFIPWPFQPKNTRLGGEGVTAFEYLQQLAISRLMLDNIQNIQASWVTQGEAIGQLALAFGANDMGGTMIEENVVRAAGTSHSLSCKRLLQLIREAGFVPVQRNTLYRRLRVYSS